eukprot:g4982.t1
MFREQQQVWLQETESVGHHETMKLPPIEKSGFGWELEFSLTNNPLFFGEMTRRIDLDDTDFCESRVGNVVCNAEPFPAGIKKCLYDEVAEECKPTYVPCDLRDENICSSTPYRHDKMCFWTGQVCQTQKKDSRKEMSGLEASNAIAARFGFDHHILRLHRHNLNDYLPEDGAAIWETTGKASGGDGATWPILKITRDWLKMSGKKKDPTKERCEFDAAVDAYSQPGVAQATCEIITGPMAFDSAVDDVDRNEIALTVLQNAFDEVCVESRSGRLTSKIDTVQHQLASYSADELHDFATDRGAVQAKVGGIILGADKDETVTKTRAYLDELTASAAREKVIYIDDTSGVPVVYTVNAVVKMSDIAQKYNALLDDDYEDIFTAINMGVQAGNRFADYHMVQVFPHEVYVQCDPGVESAMGGMHVTYPISFENWIQHDHSAASSLAEQYAPIAVDEGDTPEQITAVEIYLFSVFNEAIVGHIAQKKELSHTAWKNEFKPKPRIGKKLFRVYELCSAAARGNLDATIARALHEMNANDLKTFNHREGGDIRAWVHLIHNFGKTRGATCDHDTPHEEIIELKAALERGHIIVSPAFPAMYSRPYFFTEDGAIGPFRDQLNGNALSFLAEDRTDTNLGKSAFTPKVDPRPKLSRYVPSNLVTQDLNINDGIKMYMKDLQGGNGASSFVPARGDSVVKDTVFRAELKVLLVANVNVGDVVHLNQARFGVREGLYVGFQNGADRKVTLTIKHGTPQARNVHVEIEQCRLSDFVSMDDFNTALRTLGARAIPVQQGPLPVMGGQLVPPPLGPRMQPGVPPVPTGMGGPPRPPPPQPSQRKPAVDMMAAIRQRKMKKKRRSKSKSSDGDGKESDMR